MKTNYSKKYAEVKTKMHTCSPNEYEGLKKLLNYYYNKLNEGK